MMSNVVHTGLPLLIIMAMTIVGLELTVADLRRVLHYPMHVAAALFGQVLLLPLIAAALILILRPGPAISGGLILAAAAPQAISSNYFCLLARADIALSVTLTAVSSALAVATTPLVAGLGFSLLLEQDAGFALPVGKVAQQVVTGLLLPVTAGMLVRHYAPGFVARNHTRFQWLSVGAVVLMLAILLVDQAGKVAVYPHRKLFREYAVLVKRLPLELRVSLTYEDGRRHEKGNEKQAEPEPQPTFVHGRRKHFKRSVADSRRHEP